MEGRVHFDRKWKTIFCSFWLKPVLVYTLWHTKLIFDFDYQNKWPPYNMSLRKRSNTYWSINTCAPSVAICIARTICHRLNAVKCIVRPICRFSSAAICIDRSICHRWRAARCNGQPICHPELAAICIDCTNIPPSSIWFTKHIEIHIVLSKVWKFHKKIRNVRCWWCADIPCRSFLENEKKTNQFCWHLDPTLSVKSL